MGNDVTRELMWEYYIRNLFTQALPTPALNTPTRIFIIAATAPNTDTAHQKYYLLSAPRHLTDSSLLLSHYTLDQISNFTTTLAPL